MKAILLRDIYTETETFGILELMDDQNIRMMSCYILEDEARPEGVKIKTKTAIPEGKYLLDITFSNRFQRMMPIIYNQDDLSVVDAKGARWTGIRIHAGNTHENTDGCLLTGSARTDHSVTGSRIAYDKLFAILNSAARPIPFEIRNEPYTKN